MAALRIKGEITFEPEPGLMIWLGDWGMPAGGGRSSKDWDGGVVMLEVSVEGIWVGV